MTVPDEPDTTAELTESSILDEATTTGDVGAPDTESQPSEPNSVAGWAVSRRPVLVAAALALLVMATAALAAGLYWRQYLPDQRTDTAAADVVLSAATQGTIALLSYSPGSLDDDFATAKSHLTGDFLSYYTEFTQEVVTPAAKKKGVSTTAAVVQAAVSELHPTSATVLMFINQTTTSTDTPDPSLASSSVLVHLTKINGAWLISAFDPV